MKANVRLDDAKSVLRAAGARALATSLITGIDECAQEGRPLTQVQQTFLARMTIMAYAEIMEGESMMDIDSQALYEGREE